MPTNSERVARAKTAVEAHARACQDDYDGLPMSEMVSDLLANLHHLADAEAIDWKAVAEYATRHYLDERAK